MNEFINVNLTEDFYEENLTWLTWGNLGGINSFVGNDVNYYIGTYFINKKERKDIIKEEEEEKKKGKKLRKREKKIKRTFKEYFELFFGVKATTKEMYKDETGRWRYHQKLLDVFRWFFEDHHQYQGIMRGRGLTDDRHYGIIPECMPDWITVVERRIPSKRIKKDVDEKWFIDFFTDKTIKVKKNLFIREMVNEFKFSEDTAERRFKEYVLNSNKFKSSVDIFDPFKRLNVELSI